MPSFPLAPPVAARVLLKALNARTPVPGLRGAAKPFPVHAVADASVTALRKAFASSFSRDGITDAATAYAALELNAARLREALSAVLRRVVVASGQVHALKTAGDAAGRDVRHASIRALLQPPRLSMRFDIRNPEVAKWATQHAAKLVVDITEDARQGIANVVAKTQAGDYTLREQQTLLRESVGLTSKQGETLMALRDELEEQGLSEREIEDELSARSDEMLDTRAETIARTESMSAANQGQQELWNQAREAGLLNGDELKEWIVTPDDTLCPLCAAMEGVQVPMGEVFDFDGEQVDVPPGHPRCRCTIGLAMPGSGDAQEGEAPEEVEE